jgi:creatine kinase/arginine kinase
MQQGADIHAVFDRLSRAAAHIETVVKFAHDEHLGYITSCPTNLGTAMRASESSDATYDISNKRRLGRSEKDLVQDMYNGVKAMIDAEKALN